MNYGIKIIYLFLIISISGTTLGKSKYTDRYVYGKYIYYWKSSEIIKTEGENIDLTYQENRNRKKVTVHAGLVKAQYLNEYVNALNRLSKLTGYNTYLAYIKSPKKGLRQSEEMPPDAISEVIDSKLYIMINLEMAKYLDGDAGKFLFIAGHELAHIIKQHTNIKPENNFVADVGGAAIDQAVPFLGSLLTMPGKIKKAKEAKEKQIPYEIEADNMSIGWLKLLNYNQSIAHEVFTELENTYQGTKYGWHLKYNGYKARIENSFRFVKEDINTENQEAELVTRANIQEDEENSNTSDNELTKNLVNVNEENRKLAEKYFQEGLTFQNGDEGIKDLSIAVNKFDEAAKLGHPLAQYELGMMYANGMGVAQNHNIAFELFNKSADQEVALAQYMLGYYYEKGITVTHDNVLALKWYEKAAKGGVELASKGIERIRNK